MGESEMGCDEEIGEVLCLNLARDLGMVAGGACRFAGGAIIGRIDPNVFKHSVA